MVDLFATIAGAYAPGPVIRAVPFRTRARPMPARKMDRRNWYWMATEQITDYCESTDPNQCFVEMNGEEAPIRVAVSVSIDWLDREYAKATFCPGLFRDETDMENLV